MVFYPPGGGGREEPQPFTSLPLRWGLRVEARKLVSADVVGSMGLLTTNMALPFAVSDLPSPFSGPQLGGHRCPVL